MEAIKNLLAEIKQSEKVVVEKDNGFVIENNGRFGREFTVFFVNGGGAVDWNVYRTLESAVANL